MSNPAQRIKSGTFCFCHTEENDQAIISLRQKYFEFMGSGSLKNEGFVRLGCFMPAYDGKYQTSFILQFQTRPAYSSGDQPHPDWTQEADHTLPLRFEYDLT